MLYNPFFFDDSNSSSRILMCTCTEEADVTGNVLHIWDIGMFTMKVLPVFLHRTNIHKAASRNILSECLECELQLLSLFQDLSSNVRGTTY